MNRMTPSVMIFFLLLLFIVGSCGCGSNRRIVENDYISFSLNSNYEYAFSDPDQYYSTSEFPLGDQRRVIIWDKDFPHNWQIFIYYPCPPEVTDSLENVHRKYINDTEVLYFEIDGFYLQVYLDPTMRVGISSVMGELSMQEADKIIESLVVKKSSD